MSIERSRGPHDTLRAARVAARRAGVTRLADISGLADLGIPVFQAIRPYARSLTVSQGKGATPLAAKVAALLESCELACAEALPRPVEDTPLASLPAPVQDCWAGDRGPLTIDLDPATPRAWVEGHELDTGNPMPMPWDLVSLDFTRRPLQYPAGADGLATGNTREEAILAALGELLERHFLARFESLSPIERRALQIDTTGCDDPVLARELARVRAAGFTPRIWSLGQDCGIPAFVCYLFGPEPAMDAMAPTAGSACHPHRSAGALAALREAAQGRAALVAGARDDIEPEDYTEGRGRALALTVATLAASEGKLRWSSVPTFDCASSAEGATHLRQAIARLTPLPVVVFDHPPLAEGLHVVHALAPGLCNLSRAAAPPVVHGRIPPASARTGWSKQSRAVLFAGPSIAGLVIPSGIDLRPPAVCGDLSALLPDPPPAVGVVDGFFGLAPTVWHSEILELLARGVRIFGASSLGALRAAELAEAGMEGVGAIYAGYRAGVIERDDAVMLLHAPAEYGFAPLTLPLVDAEYALNAVACRPSERRMMQRIVRTMPYARRTWRSCLEAYRARVGKDFPISLAELSDAPSLKELDAALLVECLQEAVRFATGPAACPPPPQTSHYLRMLARTPEAAVRDREPRSRDDPARGAASPFRSTR